MESCHEPTSSGDSTGVLCYLDLEHKRRAPLRGKLYRVRGIVECTVLLQYLPYSTPSKRFVPENTCVWFCSSSSSIALRMIG